MAKKITTDGEVVDEVTREVIARVPSIYWKTPFNHDTDAESLATGLQCKDASKTQQQFAKDADINVILAKFFQTGELPHSTAAMGYRDVAEDALDLQAQIVTGWEVEQAWAKLSPEVRNTLRDPLTFTRYVTHCLQTGDLDQLEELGLAVSQAKEQAAPPGGESPAPRPPEGAAAAPKTPPAGGSTEAPK